MTTVKTGRTAPEGEIEWLKQVRIGDTVFLDKHSFKVGVIEAVSFSEDLRTKDGKVLAQKGDTQCAIAANEKALPYDKKRCDALWVFTPKCRVVETAFTWGPERLPNVPWSRSVVYELSNYSDRELHDIGIDRVDIQAIARKAAEDQQ